MIQSGNKRSGGLAQVDAIQPRTQHNRKSIQALKELAPRLSNELRLNCILQPPSYLAGRVPPARMGTPLLDLDVVQLALDRVQLPLQHLETVNLVILREVMVGRGQLPTLRLLKSEILVEKVTQKLLEHGIEALGERVRLVRE